MKKEESMRINEQASQLEKAAVSVKPKQLPIQSTQSKETKELTQEQLNKPDLK